ncbi:hypothetical protein [Flavobacterium suzhouense]|uniref:Secreted protein n=1 Tax=Flavobacterium suzhouense TaxID=1529638 RepID=A0ABW5NVV5_9FLAO
MFLWLSCNSFFCLRPDNEKADTLGVPSSVIFGTGGLTISGASTSSLAAGRGVIGAGLISVVTSTDSTLTLSVCTMVSCTDTLTSAGALSLK